MPNVFASLPMPVLNGPGTAVDTSGMGGLKTIVVDGTFEGTTITIEGSVDGGVVFAPVVVFQRGTTQPYSIEVACEWMRVNVSGRKTTIPFSADVSVGANDAPGQFTALALPAGNGAGVGVDVSAFGNLATFVVGGVFPGATISIEVSEDGGTTYSVLTTFTGKGGLATRVVAEGFVRASVVGRKSSLPFTATVAMGANDSGGGGGGSGSPERFRYTAVGGENDFMVTLPTVRATDLYTVVAALAGSAVIVGMDFPDLIAGDRTTTQFRCVTTSSLTAGDQIDFYVDELV